MTLQEAAGVFKSDVDKWTDHYLKAQKENPENWPDNMNEADWFEQFMFFCMSGK